jgi:uncharacterized protein YndB with AHSA1/START domain/pimeloyl-ACP methyl ester carboxylesterase
MADDPSNGIDIDVANNTIRIQRTYAADVDRAWWAWTDPQAISQWWGPQGWAAEIYEMDVRPGGHWRFQIAPADGSAPPVRSLATYGTVRPQTELTYRDTFVDEDWRPEGTDAFPTAVTFASTDGGCTVAVAASFPDAHALQRAVELQMADGYAEALDRLADTLDSTDAAHTTHGMTTEGDSTMSDLATLTSATLTSADGTTIAYEKSGSGPAIIVIPNVAEDRTGVAGVAAALSESFTVINFDRRGRGASGDPQPYNPAREIEDIAALIEIAGGAAALTTGSGACALALDAASALGEKVTGLYLYEPPFIVDDSRPAAPADYLEHQEKLVAAGQRSEAVEYFMTEMIGVPAEYLPAMQQDPSWEAMVRYAHTYAYEARSLAGLQDGTPLPTDRWSIDAPVAVAVGSNSEPFMRTAADALAQILPAVTVLTLADQDHSAFWMAPEPVAEQARAFLLG